MPLNLKELEKARALSYTTPNGEATFWLLPYRTALASFTEQALERSKPRYTYVHDGTGERVTEEPKERKRKREKAIAMKSEFKSDWRMVDEWDSYDNLLTGIEPLTIAIDFADTLTPEWEAFKDYWSVHSEGSIAERLEAFRAIVAIDPFNEWWQAYSKTRNNPAPAEKELGEAAPKNDPKDLLSGEPSTVDTTNELMPSLTES